MCVKKDKIYRIKTFFLSVPHRRNNIQYFLQLKFFLISNTIIYGTVASQLFPNTVFININRNIAVVYQYVYIES